MMFGELLHILPEATSIGQPPVGQIAGLAYDSRKVEPGMVFAALRGEAVDGHAFVAGAAQAGAAAALVERPVEGADLWQVQVPDSRAALAKLAAEFFGNPSRSMTMIGITGTNGKTTTMYLTESVLARQGQAGLIGTVEARFAG